MQRALQVEPTELTAYFRSFNSVGAVHLSWPTSQLCGWKSENFLPSFASFSNSGAGFQ